MKYFLAAALSLGLVHSASAYEAFRCKADETLNQLKHRDRHDQAASVGIGVDFIYAHCKNTAGKDYVAGLTGFLLSVRADNEYFLIECPLVRKSRFEGQIAEFGGVRASLTLGGGAQVGLYSNKHAGVCFIGGVNVGLGGSILFSRMRIGEGTDIESIRTDLNEFGNGSAQQPVEQADSAPATEAVPNLE